MTTEISPAALTFIETNIEQFHKSRLESIRKLDLMDLLRNKNPYLFKVKNITTPSDFVRSLLDAHLSSQEETMFGSFLVRLAKVVCMETYHGNRMPPKGIDLDFIREGAHYLVSVKSGPHWGNSRAVQKMMDDFKVAKQSMTDDNIVFVNGCCYGRDLNEDKGQYLKKCGQSFWELITADVNFYRKILSAMENTVGCDASFATEYRKVFDKFERVFIREFSRNGTIDWQWIIEYNSAMYPQGRVAKMLSEFSP